MQDNKDILKYLQRREELLSKRDAVKAEKEAELSTINTKVEEQSQLVKQLKKEYFLTLDKDKEAEYKQAVELLNGLEDTKKELDADVTLLNKNYYIDYDPETVKEEAEEYLKAFGLDAKVKKFDKKLQEAIAIAEEVGEDTKVIADDITELLTGLKDIHLSVEDKRTLHNTIKKSINGALSNKLILETDSNIDRYIPYIYEVMAEANVFYPILFYPRD
jgi:hypothetical protein